MPTMESGDDPQSRHQTFKQLAHELVRLALKDAPRSEIRRVAKLAQDQAGVERAPGQLQVASSVSSRTLDPFITIRWGELEEQLSLGEARQHVRYVLEVMEAATTDAFLTRFVIEKLDLEPGAAGVMLAEMRAYRAALAEREEPC